MKLFSFTGGNRGGRGGGGGVERLINFVINLGIGNRNGGDVGYSLKNEEYNFC